MWYPRKITKAKELRLFILNRINREDNSITKSITCFTSET